mmetsp:Transcript_7441/g.14645  ORF Transcript_7441/g.14645 Transcript_7441/m.14645 type:complete len:111 (-) Transcript_7441:616-948(-)|eukprot:CAMPEP_0175076250 /NCGR_PEP_ID=MMETSP0052_2-20121109/22594_1 /TAXON_ID=51329 ORGANISM="Polytomella parva, Strain SAG 63-3" /NCGR_SAMPLE_ID=MMETSP0052_2 /ASSEMBLY_ACC=CAM_ASM_000194 /LENGTH=110 /DNA_ID=CAMNT_0016345311 /DNA_START=59 /DNA_END=391 /DNA_ORIENTATION=-
MSNTTSSIGRGSGGAVHITSGANVSSAITKPLASTSPGDGTFSSTSPAIPDNLDNGLPDNKKKSLLAGLAPDRTKSNTMNWFRQFFLFVGPGFLMAIAFLVSSKISFFFW